MRRLANRSVIAIVPLVGVLMVAAAASAQALFRGADVEVYDSTGKQVGTLSNGATEVVFRTGLGRTVYLEVSPSRLFGNASLHFPRRGCRGAPFLDRADSGREPSSFVVGPRQTLYVQAGAFSRQWMRSTLTPFGQCWDSAEGGEFAPAILGEIDVADYFTPPFALRASPGAPVPTGEVDEPLEPTDRVVAYDATGKKVAPTMLGVLSTRFALVTAGGDTLILAGVGPAGVGFFESTDCSGTLFQEDYGFSLVDTTVLVGPRRAVYVKTDVPARLTMYSQRVGEECRVLDQANPGGYTRMWAPFAPVGIDLADYFTPPVTFRAGRGIRPLPMQ